VARPAPRELDEETFRVPASVRFPVELTPPEGFDPARVETWPEVEGRLEWVAGRLLYTPPCGDRQQETIADVVYVLIGWARAHPEFVVGTRDAGMHLGDDTRGADAAIWRRTHLGPLTGGFRTVPPLLAVEVAGRDERERQLREKAGWYFRAGVSIVWIVLPEEREVIVLTREAERSHRMGERVAEDRRLPGLAPAVDELFVQISRAG
jgi:Uma2 family endonuclease